MQQNSLPLSNSFYPGKKKYSEDEYDYPYEDPPGKLDVKGSRSKNLGDDLDRDRTTPPLSTVNEVAEVCEFCNKDAKTFPTQEMLKSMSQSEVRFMQSSAFYCDGTGILSV